MAKIPVQKKGRQLFNTKTVYLGASDATFYNHEVVLILFFKINARVMLELSTARINKAKPSTISLWESAAAQISDLMTSTPQESD